MIDRRTKVGRALAAWRADLVADLGGASALSTQQSAIVDLVTMERLILSSLDAWLAEQTAATGLVNRRSKALLPALKERTAIADSLTRHLTVLGLSRQAPPEKSLAEIVAGIEAEKRAKAAAPTKTTLAPRGEQAPAVPADRAPEPLAPTVAERGKGGAPNRQTEQPVKVRPASLVPEVVYPEAPAEVEQAPDVTQAVTVEQAAAEMPEF